MGDKRIGRPPKGDRQQVKVRLPDPLADALRAEAKRRGMTVNDLVGEFAEQLTGVPYNTQGALPLNAA